MISIEQGKKLVMELFAFELFDDHSIDDIIELLILADDLYYNDDEPIMSDINYDNLRKYAQQLSPTNKYFLGVGSDVRGNKVKLPYQMGSLDQVYEGDIVKYISNNKLDNESLTLSDKLDGASGMIVFDTDGLQIAYSRGDGIEGADITRHIKQMPSVPNIKQSLVVRGECIIAVENFPYVNKLTQTRSGKPYKNPRNAVSGMMNAKDNPSKVYKYIDFVAYEIVGSTLSKYDQFTTLKQLGFKIPQFKNVPSNQINDQYLESHLIERKQSSKYELDGIVIDVDSAQKRQQMNPTRDTLNPAYTVKFKLTEAANTVTAEVIDVEINISKDGYLKPRVNIVPVDLLGVTIQWATGFNMKFILDNQIGPKSVLKITRAGDVIPRILSTVSPMVLNNGEQYSDWFNNKINNFGKVRWTDTGVDLVLDNPNDNSTARFEQLIDFFDTLGVSHLGEGNLQKIFELGFETPDSVLLLTQEDISTIIGSNIIGKKIFSSLKSKLTNIPLYTLMGAHPYFGRGVGVRKMKKLYEAFAGDMSKCSDIKNIIDVDGFDEKTATKIQKGYQPFIEFLNSVDKCLSIMEYQSPIIGTLTGKTIVFTGFRDSSLEKAVESAGGKMGSSVSSKTNFVVTTNVNGTSGKLAKARTLNVPIIGIDELKSMI